MPMHTRMNANSVPMFVRSTIESSDVNIAVTPTKTPVMIVPTCGVRNRGCTFEKNRGSSPSRDMAKKMRGCPSWKTRSTAVCAMTEPKATTPTIQPGIMTYFMAIVSGSACSLLSVFTRSRYGTIPVKTAAMSA